MTPKEILKQQFLEVVENQLRENSPRETRKTLDRLQHQGYSMEDAKLVISQCVAQEITTGIKSKEPFDEARYVRCLLKLPDFPG